MNINSIYNYSMETLDTILNRENGPSFSNRYVVNINYPEISTLNFSKFSILEGARPNERLNFLCDSISLPGRRIATEEATDIRKTSSYPYTYSNDEIQMSFILGSSYFAKKLFDIWADLIIDPRTYILAYKDEIVADWEIGQLDLNNKVIYGMKLERAYPIEVGSVELSNNNGNQIQKFNVTAKFENYEVFK